MAKFHKITNLLSGIICNICKTDIEKGQTCWEKSDQSSFRIHDLCYKKENAPNAYEKWSTEDDLFVKEKILADVSSKDIADTLKRKRNAITSRVKHFTDHEHPKYDVQFTLRLRRKHYSFRNDKTTGENFTISYKVAGFENNCQKCRKTIQKGDLICKVQNSEGYFIHEWHLHDKKSTKPIPLSSATKEDEFDWESSKNDERIVTTKEEHSPKSNDNSQSDIIRNCPKCKKQVYLNSKNTQYRASQWEHKQCPTEKQPKRKKSSLSDEESSRILFGDVMEFAYDSELEKVRKKAESDYYEKKRDERSSRDN